MSGIKISDITCKYIGEFIVYNSGRLERGRKHYLHTNTTTIDYGDDHVHIKGQIIDIATNHNSKPSLNAKFRDRQFTLDGFYAHNSFNEKNKEKALYKETRKSNSSFRFDSIATHSRTRIKILENAYRRYVSNQ